MGGAASVASPPVSKKAVKRLGNFSHVFFSQEECELQQFQKGASWRIGVYHSHPLRAGPQNHPGLELAAVLRTNTPWDCLIWLH